jgi:hypothetical protein
MNAPKIPIGSWRSRIIFTVGIAGIVFVTLTEGTDRPTLLLLFSAMVGLPAFLSADESRKPPRNGDGKP